MPSINLTPMLDVVFLLLIFFLLTSIAVTQPVLNLSLPTAVHAEKGEEGDAVQVVIRKGGSIEIDQETIALKALETTLQQKVGDHPEKKIVISADREAPFGLFVRLLDTAQGLNLKNMAILTRTDGEKP